jgi:hypothetical protein
MDFVVYTLHRYAETAQLNMHLFYLVPLYTHAYMTEFQATMLVNTLVKTIISCFIHLCHQLSAGLNDCKTFLSH